MGSLLALENGEKQTKTMQKTQKPLEKRQNKKKCFLTHNFCIGLTHLFVRYQQCDLQTAQFEMDFSVDIE